MKPINLPFSEKIADVIDARLGECVANVVRAILDHPDVVPKLAFYVEGFWMTGGQLDPHMWIETKETIIDPTLVRLAPRELRKTAKHFPLRVHAVSHLRARFENHTRGPGTRLEFELDFTDPEINELEHVFDPLKSK